MIWLYCIYCKNAGKKVVVDVYSSSKKFVIDKEGIKEFWQEEITHDEKKKDEDIIDEDIIDEDIITTIKKTDNSYRLRQDYKKDKHRKVHVPVSTNGHVPYDLLKAACNKTRKLVEDEQEINITSSSQYDDNNSFKVQYSNGNPVEVRKDEMPMPVYYRGDHKIDPMDQRIKDTD